MKSRRRTKKEKEGKIAPQPNVICIVLTEIWKPVQIAKSHVPEYRGYCKISKEEEKMNDLAALVASLKSDGDRAGEGEPRDDGAELRLQGAQMEQPQHQQRQ